MRVLVLRTGGFAGIAMRAEVRRSDLDPALGVELERLVERCDFFHLPARIESREGGYDRFQFDILVEDDERSHRVACGESGMDEALNDLVRFTLRVGRLGES